MRDLGGPVIGDVRAAAELDAACELPSLLGRSFSSRATSLVAGVPSWDVDAGAWVAGLAAWACHVSGARGDVLVAVRVAAESPAAAL